MDVNEVTPLPESLGLHYGFRRSPYDPSPLGIDADDSTLFIGREREGREFRTFLTSFDRGAIFIEAGTGVGKTSFVNVQEYRISRVKSAPGLLPTLQPIQLASALSPTEFLLSVLSNVLSALERSSPAVGKRAEFKQLSAAVTQSLITTRAWQVEVAGFGGGTSRETTATNPLVVLLPVVSELLDRAARLAAGSGVAKLVVNVNNLDLIDSKTLTSFLELTRDLTLTRPGFLWVFIGPIGSRSVLAQRSRRVSELVRTDPVWLPPLTLKEVHAAIAARVQRFQTSPSTPAPISQEVVALLYEASAGELRYILNRCTDLLLSTMIEYPTTREVDLPIAEPLLRRATLRAIERCNLTRRQEDLLTRVVSSGPCQPKDFRSYGLRSAPAFVRYLLRFYELGLVDRRRRGPDVVYTPRGDVRLALRDEKR